MLKVTVAIFLFGLVSVYGAEPSTETASILSESSDIDPEGGYGYSYESSNGIKVEQHGELKKVDVNNSAEAVEGSFQYTAPDGTPVVVSYTADENGYQPHGDVLPVAPEVPAPIARALKYLEEHPAPKEGSE